MDEAFSDMHSALFESFGAEGHIGTKIFSVVIARDVDDVDEYNEVVRLIDKATFLKDHSTYGGFIEPNRGDELRIREGIYSGVYKLGKVVENNAHVIGREIVKTGCD